MQVKKLYSGHYLHVPTQKHITLWQGDKSRFWSIFHDSTLCDEMCIGFNTKRQAIEYLNNLMNESDDNWYQLFKNKVN